MQLNHSPFQLPLPAKLRWLAYAGECLLGLNKLDSFYRQRQNGMNSEDFLRYTLNKLNVDYTVASGSCDSIPAQGPTIVIANHPFGAIEGVMLAELLLKHRADTKVLANQYLHRIDELSELFIGVDVFETSSSIQANIQGVKQAIQHLKQGGLLLVFPAGEVSSLQIEQRKITDRKWNRIIAMMVRKTQASTTPIYIEGNNSKWFHLAGLLHARFRTLLLVREMLNKRQQKVKLHIGQNIAFSELKTLSSDQAITHYLRMNTYLLAGQTENKSDIEKNSRQPMQTIALPVDKNKLQQDVDKLPTECLLVSNNKLSVYCATAKQLPHVLTEIGRLREITFRHVAEGTGMASDTDEYDKDYLHMFLWNNKDQQIAGAYRLGLVDRLINKHGVKALYSHSLFRYDKAFIDSLGNSIEMGRSFVCIEYQRSLSALLLLWKGIAAFASRHPQYTTLFGPVSISNGYSELSRNLMTGFLQLHHYDHQRAEMVRARCPHKKKQGDFWSKSMLKNVKDNQLISKLIYRMEGDKGLPVLLRQYLGLNGKLVSFNVDRDFNNALDGMIIVDLLKVPEKTLAKYMGTEEAKIYLSR